MAELPIAPIERILKRNAKDMKISKEAKELLAMELEKEGERLSKKAIDLAKKDGRKTVQAKDIMRWRPLNEMTDKDYVYKFNDGRVRYNRETPSSCWRSKDEAVALPVKFLKNTLLFGNKLYTNVEDEIDAKRIMESYEKTILDSLMESHWAYNIYEYRAWEGGEQISENIIKFSMWFDDYDGGDVIVDGFLFI